MSTTLTVSRVSSQSFSRLANISTNVYRSVRSALEPVSIRKGTVLFDTNDCVDCIYFPETAVFSERLRKSANEERMIELGLIGSNGAAGVIQALIGMTSANYTIAIKSGTAMKLEVEKFLQMVEEHPELREATDVYLTSFIRSRSQRPACLLFHSSKQRFCRWLLAYFQKSRSSTLRATHGEIAECLGIYRPNVTLLAHQLTDEKLIACSRGSLTILDSVRLQLWACGCP